MPPDPLEGRGLCPHLNYSYDFYHSQKESSKDAEEAGDTQEPNEILYNVDWILEYNLYSFLLYHADDQALIVPLAVQCHVLYFYYM